MIWVCYHGQNLRVVSSLNLSESLDSADETKIMHSTMKDILSLSFGGTIQIAEEDTLFCVNVHSICEFRKESKTNC